MTTLLEKARNGQGIDLEIIDMHGHLGANYFGVPQASPMMVINSMDKIGVDKIVVSSFKTLTPYSRLGNEEVFAAMQTYPQRILGYVVVWPEFHDAVAAECQYWLDKGFTGMKFHSSTGHRYSTAAYEAAYKAADERKLPCLFHVFGKRNDFEDISAIAKKHPDIKILMAHTGSKDLDSYLRMAQQYDNVFLELCYSLAPNGLVDLLCERVGAQKVIYGSDCPFYSMTQQIGRVLGAKCSEEEKALILGGNARKILDEIES